ncbi:hypothetical protein AVEN_265118-1 [Araneus ventricosus]|uniref:Uncharacterized protein n=1 Tax=Araneus ventricosus TaxID=182803 RepID=A0A4Y2NLF2_ARAVE|nr:hypothetical protein AVEN_265118-1 [Araneus ventricosus]
MENFISCALPGIGEETIKELNEKIKDIGVLVFEDLKYMEEDHIKNVLKPIQVKNFLEFSQNSEIIPRATSHSVDFCPADSLIFQAVSVDTSHHISDQATSSVTNDSDSVTPSVPYKNWAEDFTVPFPKKLRKPTKKGSSHQKCT